MCLPFIKRSYRKDKNSQESSQKFRIQRNVREDHDHITGKFRGVGHMQNVTLN
jgi:hypothetical protein